MRTSKGNHRTIVVALLLFGVLSAALLAQGAKEAESGLDHLAFARPELRVASTHVDSEALAGRWERLSASDALRAEYGPEWRVVYDERRGVPSLVEGGAIPWIPGPANDLRPPVFRGACPAWTCASLDEVEALGRRFLAKHAGLFDVNQEDLALNREGSGPFGHMYYLSFGLVRRGVPVEGASIVFRINNGNLVQVATGKVGPVDVDTSPALSIETAWANLRGYLGEFASEEDEILDPGALVILPVTPAGQDPDAFSGPPGSGIAYVLVYSLRFKREGVRGTWEARVDAHTGEILSFLDSDKYGRVHGGVYATDGHAAEVDRPFPYADIGGTPGQYAGATGVFSGGIATSTLAGQYVKISDKCGAISLSTSSGDLDFSSASGADCATPGVGGAGNTRASRTQYVAVNLIRAKAKGYFPSNAWLDQQILDKVNQSTWCNANWDGASINFYKADSGKSCLNTGELPGIAFHEWGHALDDFDGSGTVEDSPVETRADWTAILQTHDSCFVSGLLTSGKCTGYGDACLSCAGWREADWDKHAKHTPWTPQNFGSTWNCNGLTPSYYGPCGLEDHCESGIATQALWDFANRDLTASPTSMDASSAWQLADRLFYLGMPTLTAMYACSGTPKVSDGCGGGSLYSVLRAVDDDGDGTANGTPHAAAIFAALSRHGIACGASGDAANQNQTTCASLGKPSLSAVPGDGSVTLTWTASSGPVGKYLVLRSDVSCGSGSTVLGEVAAPGTTFTDTAVANDMTYFYRVQAQGANAACASPVSDCAAAKPMDCHGTLSLNKAVYICADSVAITVKDLELQGLGSYGVQAFSTVESLPESVTLAEASGTPGVFTGSIATTSSPAVADGKLSVADGGTLTVRYVDPSYCGVPNQNVDATATVDCTYPAVTSVAVTNLTSSSATVTWTTDEASNSRVTYGTSSPPGTNKDDPAAYVTSHSVTLTGLSAATPYLFSVTSADSLGNATISDNGGAYYAFTTMGRSYVLGPDDVEGGQGAWTATGQWHVSTCRASSGTHAWKAGATACPGTYSASTTSDLTSVPLNLGPSGHRFHLRWNEWYNVQGLNDIHRVQVSPDAGATWLDLYVGTDATSTTWLARDVDLSAYTGTVIVRFRFSTDAGSNYEGWYVDDILVGRDVAAGPELHDQSYGLADSCSGGGPGSGDGILDPGEAATLSLTLANWGLSGATSVSATLSTTAPGVSITRGTASFVDVPAGGTGGSASPHFAFQVTDTAACFTDIPFTLHAVSAQGSWDGTLTVPVGSRTAGSASTTLNEHFATTSLPAGWTTETVSGLSWIVNTSNSFCDGAYAISVGTWNSSPTDAWIYTPGQALTAHGSCTLTFNQSVTWGTPNLSVWLGTSAGRSAMTTLLWASNPVSNAYCTKRMVTFTVPADGSYYIGFHTTKAANTSYTPVVDDVVLACTPVTCAVQPCTGPSAPGETAPGATRAAAQDWSGKATATWPSNAQATSYKLYRGTKADLPNLLNSGADSCLRWSGSGLGATADETPSAGSFYWYLVTGVNANGEGSAGTATGGPRQVNSTGSCP